ncbi:CHST15 [Symbiodinium pilosum]|uniref:CHST15 protein n=1 Tax=Symbiodinium pilosum TaxID=2952 RepID=A0A812PHL6_SYMPI|nr:CHST15 [Symbiodinium pilosum]
MLLWAQSHGTAGAGCYARIAGLGGGLVCLLGYVNFFAWLWACQLRAFPGYRGKYKNLWLTFTVHWETLKRFVGLLTSPIRRLPDFYVVGCPKCGTSTIYHYLTLHPRIVLPAYKESRFIWGRTGLYLSSLRLRSLFPTWIQCPSGHLTFDADPTAAVAPKFASALLHRLTPNAKIIIAYREPVEAAWSMYRFRSRIKGRFDFGWTFQQMYGLERKLAQSSCWAELDALADSLDEGATSVWITPDIAFHGVNSSMLRPQRIADVLAEFEARFGQGNVLLIPFSALVSSTEATMRRIYRFVGLDAETIQLPSRLNVQPEDVMELVVSKETRCQSLTDDAARLLTAYYAEQKLKFAEMTGETFECHTDPSIGDVSQGSAASEDIGSIS